MIDKKYLNLAKMVEKNHRYIDMFETTTIKRFNAFVKKLSNF